MPLLGGVVVVAKSLFSDRFLSLCVVPYDCTGTEYFPAFAMTYADSPVA
jgi:hypothetical protein